MAEPDMVTEKREQLGQFLAFCERLIDGINVVQYKGGLSPVYLGMSSSSNVTSLFREAVKRGRKVNAPQNITIPVNQIPSETKKRLRRFLSKGCGFDDYGCPESSLAKAMWMDDRQNLVRPAAQLITGELDRHYGKLSEIDKNIHHNPDMHAHLLRFVFAIDHVLSIIHDQPLPMGDFDLDKTLDLEAAILAGNQYEPYGKNMRKCIIKSGAVHF